jgi:flavin-binding protein dodecin
MHWSDFSAMKTQWACPVASLTRIQRKMKMSMLKVIEVLAESDKSFEDAAQVAVTRAGKTVHNIKSIYIREMPATVENGKIKTYRINGKISFALD